MGRKPKPVLSKLLLKPTPGSYFSWEHLKVIGLPHCLWLFKWLLRWPRWPRINWLLMTRVLRSSSSLAMVTTTEVRPHFRFFLGHFPPLWSPHWKTWYWWVCDLGFPTYLIWGNIPEELQLFYDKLHKISNLLLSWTHPMAQGQLPYSVT